MFYFNRMTLTCLNILPFMFDRHYSTLYMFSTLTARSKTDRISKTNCVVS